MEIDDIVGTRSTKPSTKPFKDLMYIKDIEGTQGKDRTIKRTTDYKNMDYRDITKNNWESKRQTNPLKPEYTVRDQLIEGDFMKMTVTGLNQNYGAIDGNKSCALPNAIAGVRNLNTKDVGGAQSDTKRIGSFTHY